MKIIRSTLLLVLGLCGLQTVIAMDDLERSLTGLENFETQDESWKNLRDLTQEMQDLNEKHSHDTGLRIDPKDTHEDDGARLILRRRKKGAEKKVEPSLDRDKKEEKSELTAAEWFGYSFGGVLFVGIFYLLFVQKSNHKQAIKLFKSQ